MQRLYKQAARGQLDCDDHEKTLYSLNHLLKMERKHDDSMIASICDVVLQKPELRSELMSFVQREHRVVSTLLDDEARKNPSRNLERLERAMSELNQNTNVLLAGSGVSGGGSLASGSRRSSRNGADVAYEELDETRSQRSMAGSLTGRSVRSNSSNNSTQLAREKMETKAKAPGYPTANRGAPTKYIEDPELADYVKSLENTVDDKLRVLLDTHSNNTDAKMNMQLKKKTLGKTSKGPQKKATS